MPFYKDSMSYGNLYILFNVEFPKKNEIKNIEELKKVNYLVMKCVFIYFLQILPYPANLPQFDKKNVTYLEDYDKESMTTTADGNKGKQSDEEDDDMPRGQKVQCAQQ